MVFAFVDDLLFSSKIRSAAKQTGSDLRVLRFVAEAGSAWSASTAPLALVDMNGRAFDPLAVILALKEQPGPTPRTIAFVSHVRVDLVEAARAAGADEVLARSAFVSQLHNILASATPDSAS